jgi:hypothetical protein
MVSMSRTPRGLIPSLIATFATKLRFPQLFLFTAVLFFLDLLIPDLIPFFDEVLLGLITLLLGMWKKNSGTVEQVDSGEKPPMKDITPPD